MAEERRIRNKESRTKNDPEDGWAGEGGKNNPTFIYYLIRKRNSCIHLETINKRHQREYFCSPSRSTPHATPEDSQLTDTKVQTQIQIQIRTANSWHRRQVRVAGLWQPSARRRSPTQRSQPGITVNQADVNWQGDKAATHTHTHAQIVLRSSHRYSSKQTHTHKRNSSKLKFYFSKCLALYALRLSTSVLRPPPGLPLART